MADEAVERRVAKIGVVVHVEALPIALHRRREEIERAAAGSVARLVEADEEEPELLGLAVARRDLDELLAARERERDEIGVRMRQSAETRGRRGVREDEGARVHRRHEPRRERRRVAEEGERGVRSLTVRSGGCELEAEHMLEIEEPTDRRRRAEPVGDDVGVHAAAKRLELILPHRETCEGIVIVGRRRRRVRALWRRRGSHRRGLFNGVRIDGLRLFARARRCRTVCGELDVGAAGREERGQRRDAQRDRQARRERPRPLHDSISRHDARS